MHSQRKIEKLQVLPTYYIIQQKSQLPLFSVYLKVMSIAFLKPLQKRYGALQAQNTTKATLHLLTSSGTEQKIVLLDACPSYSYVLEKCPI